MSDEIVSFIYFLKLEIKKNLVKNSFAYFEGINNFFFFSFRIFFMEIVLWGKRKVLYLQLCEILIFNFSLIFTNHKYLARAATSVDFGNWTPTSIQLYIHNGSAAIFPISKIAKSANSLPPTT